LADLIWRNTGPQMLTDSRQHPKQPGCRCPTMDPHALTPLPSVDALVRRRVRWPSSEPAFTLVPSLPDEEGWGRLTDGDALPPPVAQALNRAAQARRLTAGTALWAQQSVDDQVTILVSGTVALGRQSDGGNYRTERQVQGPAWPDLASALLGEGHPMDACVVEDSVVIELPRDALQGVLDRHPTLAVRLMALLAQEVHALSARTQELMHKDASARLAAWLAERCHAAGEEGDRTVVELPMRKRDIASQLAMTPETLSRLMRTLSRKGVIAVEGYVVEILDRDALQRLAAS